MQSPQNNKYPTAAVGAAGDFFIPDLCGPRPVFFLVLLSELVVLAYVLAENGLPRFDWALFASSSLVVQWIVLGSAMLLCLARHRFSQLSVPGATLASLLVVLLVTLLVSLAGAAWLPWLQGRGLGGWWLLRNLLLAFVLAAIALRYFYLQQQLRMREKLELQSRLDSLRARIRPHFLFNTLNSIASLIASRPGEAERAVEDLAELFRASLKESAEETTVDDELRLCATYLDIEKLRLGERLQVHWQVDDAARELPMPSLLLQPLVENAVYHGIARLPEGGAVRISLHCEGERIRCAVENPLADPGGDPGGNRIGLDNVSQRMRALFGKEGEFRVERDGGNFRATLSYRPEALV